MTRIEQRELSDEFRRCLLNDIQSRTVDIFKKWIRRRFCRLYTIQGRGYGQKWKRLSLKLDPGVPDCRRAPISSQFIRGSIFVQFVPVMRTWKRDGSTVKNIARIYRGDLHPLLPTFLSITNGISIIRHCPWSRSDRPWIKLRIIPMKIIFAFYFEFTYSYIWQFVGEKFLS